MFVRLGCVMHGAGLLLFRCHTSRTARTSVPASPRGSGCCFYWSTVDFFFRGYESTLAMLLMHGAVVALWSQKASTPWKFIVDGGGHCSGVFWVPAGGWRGY